MTDIVLSEKSKALLEQIVATPGKNAAELAKELGVSVSQVNGSMQSLKKANLVTVEDGAITATEAAMGELEYGAGSATAEAPKTVIHQATAGKADTSSESDNDTAEIIETPFTAAATPSLPPTSLAANATSTPVVAEAKPAAPSKAERANAILTAMMGAQRRDQMAALMGPELGLTENCANTYIYNWRKKNGMVKARTAAPVEVAATAEAPAITAEVAIETASGSEVVAATSSTEAPTEVIVTDGESAPAEAAASESTEIAATAEEVASA